jgi:hypothetical protein
MIGYHIEVGYNNIRSTEIVRKALLTVVKTICATPGNIITEARRVERLEIPDNYADNYREPWQDSTISIVDDGEKFQVMQLASGGGMERDFKEAMRRAFCRLVIAEMHARQMEVNLIVA